jgi:hypothetical protein
MRRLLLCMMVLLLFLLSGCRGSGERSMVFDPQSVKVGDKEGAFTVQDVLLGDGGMEKVTFKGSFTIKGKLIGNLIGGSKYLFICEKDEIIKNLPVATTWELDKQDHGKIFRLLTDEIVAGLIGEERADKIDRGIEEGQELEYIIEGKFENFIYWTRPGTDVISSFELVEIISIQEN